VQLLLRWDPSEGGEGPIAAQDGSLLFAKQDLNQIIKIDKNGKSSVYLEDTNGATGLAYDLKGRLIGAGSKSPHLMVLTPTRSTLADMFEGQPILRANDLVIDKKGGVYFSDIVASTPPGPPPPPARQPGVFYLKPNGQVVLVTQDPPRPNGVQLSPDERVLYVGTPPGDFVLAFDVQPDGSVRNGRNFARIAETGQAGGADGLAVDATGRLYVASFAGVQVFSSLGQHLGTIPMPTRPANLAFGGSDKKTLYVVGRGAAYKVQLLAQGFAGRAK
jgi:gluconolactonase